MNEPMVEDHSLYFPETGFWILLWLWGTFFYFSSSRPSNDTLQNSEEVYMITPSRWDPHCEAYMLDEEAMLDWEGNMVKTKK